MDDLLMASEPANVCVAKNGVRFSDDDDDDWRTEYDEDGEDNERFDLGSV